MWNPTARSEMSTAPADQPDAPPPDRRPRKPRGFAAMDPKKVSEIASKGGKAAHAAGTAHQFSSDEAREAGRRGGLAPHAHRGAPPKSGPELVEDEDDDEDKTPEVPRIAN